MRKKELQLKPPPKNKTANLQAEEKARTIKEIRQESITPPKKEEREETKNPANPYGIVLKLVKNMDTGQGVSYEKIITSSGIGDCENIIKSLIEEGEIFEIRPGIVKVL